MARVNPIKRGVTGGLVGSLRNLPKKHRARMDRGKKARKIPFAKQSQSQKDDVQYFLRNKPGEFFDRSGRRKRTK